MKRFSFLLIAIATIIIVGIFAIPLKEEIIYQVSKVTGTTYSLNNGSTISDVRVVTPVNTDFSITIPSINATAPVIDNVSPYIQSQYLKALKDGVAHAQGTAYPGQTGNVYLFAHSTDAFYNVGKYNAVFFLIGHLQTGNEIDIYYRSKLYKYIVYDKKVIEPTDTKYLGTLIPGEKTLTLQTCYPPGTTIKRLVVLAKIQESGI